MNEDMEPGRSEPDVTSGRPGGDGARSEAAPPNAGDQVKKAVDDVGQQARQAAEQAKQAAGKVRERAEDLADSGKEMGAGQMQRIARAARGAADELEGQSPDMADAVRRAADGLDRAATSIRGRSVGEIVDMFNDFAKRQPVAFFGSAVLAGFVLTRFMKSRAERPTRSSDRGEPTRTAWPEPREPGHGPEFASPADMPAKPSTVGETAP
jgi:hypothetical protein